MNGGAPSTPPPGRPLAEVVSIQYLRGFAAMMVAAHHAIEQFAQTRVWFPENLGATGVDVFFIISGFVMTYTTGLKPIGRGLFMMRRLVRIVPLYWILTLFTAALLLIAPQLVRRSAFELGSLVQSMLFIPHWNPADHTSFSPMLKLGWTLNYEMIFYLVFALFLPARLRTRLIGVAAIFALFLALRAMPGRDWAIVEVYGSPIVFEFLLGCLLGALDLRGLTARLPRNAGFALIAAGAAGLWFGAPWMYHGDWRVIVCGIPAAAVAAGFVVIERSGERFRKDGFLGRLGDASYSIYLGHLYAVIAFRVVWEKLHLPIDGLIGALLFIVPCALTGIAVGMLVHYLIERPANRLLGPIVRGRSANASNDMRQNRGGRLESRCK